MGHPRLGGGVRQDQGELRQLRRGDPPLGGGRGPAERRRRPRQGGREIVGVHGGVDCAVEEAGKDVVAAGGEADGGPKVQRDHEVVVHVQEGYLDGEEFSPRKLI